MNWDIAGVKIGSLIKFKTKFLLKRRRHENSYLCKFLSELGLLKSGQYTWRLPIMVPDVLPYNKTRWQTVPVYYSTCPPQLLGLPNICLRVPVHVRVHSEKLAPEGQMSH